MQPTQKLDKALRDAARSPGWNFRPDGLQRFKIGECTIIVVPCRRWTYRRRARADVAQSEWAQG